MRKVIATFEGNKKMAEVYLDERQMVIVGKVDMTPLKINWDNLIYGFDVQWQPQKKHNPIFKDIKN